MNLLCLPVVSISVCHQPGSVCTCVCHLCSWCLMDNAQLMMCGIPDWPLPTLAGQLSLHTVLTAFTSAPRLSLLIGGGVLGAQYWRATWALNQ